MLNKENAFKTTVKRIAVTATALSVAQLAYSQETVDAGNGYSDIEEVVVTARKRQESLQDVPLSIQVFTSESLVLGGIDNVEDMVGKAPNLSLSSNPLSPGSDFLNIVIRGVGAQSAGAPAVGTFVDGAFVPSLGFDIGFLDVERVEVLRGPQGTLFGRNTQGGALNIVVSRPDEDFRGRVAFSYDEFETTRAQGSASGQLTDSFFAGIAADISRTDGFLTNPVVANSAGANGRGRSVSANDESKYSFRGALRYKPSEQLDVNLTLDRSYRSGLDGLPGVARGSKNYIVRSDFQIDGLYENNGSVLNVDYHLDNLDITSITSYRKVSTSLPFDFDGSPERSPNFQDIRSEQELFSQEFRFNGEIGDEFNWLAGLYGFKEKQISDRSIQFADIDLAGGSDLLVDAQTQNLDRSGYAVFTDLIWTPNDWLELGVGVRYASEKVDSKADLDFVLRNNGVDLLKVVATPRGSLKDSNVSPTASIRVKLNDDVSAYGRYARGFRAGGFPLAPASAISNVSFESEVSDNYELGLKGHLFNRVVDFDLSIFKIDISDQQLTTIVFFNDDPNLPIASVGNAGESTSEGYEANVNVRASDNFVINSSVGYTKAEYSKYIDTTGQDRAGELFPYVPKITAQLGGTLTLSAGDWGEWELNAQYRYVDEILSGSGIDVDVQFPVDSYHILDLRASLYKGDWRLDLFVDNATDEYVETRVFNAFFFDQQKPFSTVLPPQKFGARITYDF